MKPVSQRLARVALALVVALIGVRGGPAAPQTPSCAGEIWHVSLERHTHFFGRVSAAGNPNPAPGVGFPTSFDIDVRVHGRYVSKPQDGKVNWTHRTISWSGQLVDDVPVCRKWTCDAGGERELGPLEGAAPPAITTDEARDLKWNCREEKTGNCFGYFHADTAIPVPKIVSRDKLLRGQYREVRADGTRYSVWIEPLGHASIDVWAHPTEIPPNDDATSDIKLVASCDGVPLKNEEVQLSIDVEPKSGGHSHIPNRPRGKLDGTNCGFETGAPPDAAPCITIKTDASGRVKVKFEPPDKNTSGTSSSSQLRASKTGVLGGVYKVTARLTRYPDRSRDARIIVRSSDLVSLADDSPYYDICARSTLGCKPGEPGVGKRGTQAHPDGMYGTAATLDAFQGLAKDFLELQQVHNYDLGKCGKDAWATRKLSVNDIALSGGGRFDINNNWSHPHGTHGLGYGGDFNHFKETSTVYECGDSAEQLDDWLTVLLLALAEPTYGCMDQWDLAQPEHNLHLHVQDRTC